MKCAVKFSMLKKCRVFERIENLLMVLLIAISLLAGFFETVLICDGREGLLCRGECTNEMSLSGVLISW